MCVVSNDSWKRRVKAVTVGSVTYSVSRYCSTGESLGVFVYTG